jgi:hypothetical protein
MTAGTDERLPLTGLWRRESRAGSPYYSGVLDVRALEGLARLAREGDGRVRVLLFQQRDPREGAPDLRLVAVPLAPPARENAEREAPAPAARELF